jgi:hypothetical protein
MTNFKYTHIYIYVYTLLVTCDNEFQTILFIIRKKIFTF